ncbi:NADP-dependent oxidoreductase (plasmid) [Niallia taxi]|uniref:NADP-dependent oxidoreductase n=1 Tax=Niallia taxi TaxID=2499688 RepID=A0A3S2TWD6_9BACI|nr:NADP-dependent oxidoreductase [Niallia taxi]MED4036463.1 NADP-dependent oxidoreductase [Niallia taxi]RVT60840.1 NADP-dependent oxidoreductase [Niallia taxi]
MKAVVINQYGGKEELVEQEVNKPNAQANQVVLKLEATSINPIDWKLREGYLKAIFDWKFPIILGWDAAGVITDIGSNVTKWKVGDRVFSRPETTRLGTYAEYIAIDEHLLAKLPDSISYEEAAAVPLAGLTAWQALFTHGHLKEGETVLIHAGAGGVGIFSIQLAKYVGAHVITTASEKNHELLYSLGADQVIDYKKENFEDVLKDVDLVFDTIGGEVAENSYKVLKQKTGRLITIVGEPNHDTAKSHNVSAKGIWLQPDGEQLQRMADLMENKKIKSIVGATFPFSKQGIYDAHALSETHHAVGKIVIKF